MTASTTPRSDAFAVTVDDSMTVREGEWDGARGEREIFDWATGEDGDVDWAKAARGFIVADLNPPAGESITRASFKLPIAYVVDGELVGIGNAIRNALARLPQTEGLSDAVRAEAEGKLRGMLDKLSAQDRGDVERSEEERAQIREEFPRLIDMTPSQMREWSESPFAGENRKNGAERESARDALRRVIALKDKPMSDWTEGDYDDAVKAIAFVKRMSEVEQGDPIVIEGREGPSERDASLRDWGHWTDAADAMAEPIAREFHDAYERLAPDYGYKTRQESAVAWDQIPEANRSLMVATVSDLLGRGVIAAPVMSTRFSVEQLRQAGMHADASDRVYRTCTLDFAIDAETRTAIDRALEIADEAGPRTDAAQVNAIADRLRADGFSDKVTADGRLIVTGYAARTGSQLYGDGKRTWYEYRSEDEVEKSLAGYANATFTDDHPPVLVSADNWRDYARGHVGAGAVLLPPDDDGHRYVKVTICVGDVATIRKMRDGKVELSAGYTTIAVRDPGVDAQGVRYTYRQTDIQINHLALVDQGRAGHRARVYIDGHAAVFEIDDEDTDMINTDQMTPEAAMALLDAIKAYGYADSPEAAEAAMQSIATMLELDAEMVKQHLGGGEMMEMDGVALLVSKDVADKLRARETKVHGDAAKLATDLASAQGKLSALTRQVDALQAAKTQADMRDLEREIAPLCPQLVSTWKDNASARPDSMTAMRVAAICDLDAALKVDLDAAMGPDPSKPAPTFDAFVEALYRTSIRHAVARKSTTTSDASAQPSFRPTIDTSNVYGKTATH